MRFATDENFDRRILEGLLKRLPVPGVIIVARNTPIGLAIDELEIMLQVYTALEFENQVHYIPIR